MISNVEINTIIGNNITNNILCFPLELRPQKLAQAICALANKEGGFIFVGAELSNGEFVVHSLEQQFDVDKIMTKVKSQLQEISIEERIVFLKDGQRIFVIKVSKSINSVSYDNKYYIYEDNTIHIASEEQINKKYTLFLSYASCDEPIADLIEKAIKEQVKEKIAISRYTKIGYKNSFRAFMNSIQDHDYVLCIVSDSYLKSKACMYEVGETIKDHHFRDKMVFVILSEKERKYYVNSSPDVIAPEIYDSNGRAKYIRYWKRKFEDMEKEITEIKNYEATRQLSQELNEIGNIFRNDIGEFVSYLADANGLTFEKLKESNFNEIINIILN